MPAMNNVNDYSEHDMISDLQFNKRPSLLCDCQQYLDWQMWVSHLSSPLKQICYFTLFGCQCA